MPNSRETIRQLMVEEIPHAFTGVAADTASSTTELVDVDDEFLYFLGDGETNLQGYWIVRPDAAAAADRVRRVSSADPGQGLLRVSRAWTNAPDAEAFELYPPEFRPALIDAAINRGLKRLPYIIEESITPVANDNSYALSGYTWVTNERSIREVYQEYNSSTRYTREEYPWWKVFSDAGTFTLRLHPYPSTATGNSIIIEGISYYTALATDAATTACPADWAAAAGLVELYRSMRRQTHGQDTTRWDAEFADQRRALTRLTRRYAPRRGRRIMPRTPWVGPASTRIRGELLY